MGAGYSFIIFKSFIFVPSFGINHNRIIRTQHHEWPYCDGTHWTVQSSMLSSHFLASTSWHFSFVILAKYVHPSRKKIIRTEPLRQQNVVIWDQSPFIAWCTTRAPWIQQSHRFIRAAVIDKKYLINKLQMRYSLSYVVLHFSQIMILLLPCMSPYCTLA